MIIIPSNVGSPIPSDPSWANVSLLVKDIGINGATNSSFRDDGPYNFLPARNGDVTQGSFSPFGPLSGDAPPQIGGSVYFDGTGDYLTVSSNAAFSYGSGDFTIEFWYSLAGAVTGNYILYSQGLSSDYSAMVQLYNGTLFFYPGVSSAISGSVTVSVGSWNHVAVVRYGTTTTLYHNGVSVATGSSLSYGSGNRPMIGSHTDFISSNCFPGSISNVRAVKGTAVYTAAFTPPTAPLTAVAGTSLLTCQSSTAITDASSNAFTVTKYGDARAVVDSPFGYGSVYFDGSGDGVSVPDNTALQFGTGDFTVECWYYPSSLSSYHGLFDKIGTGGIALQSTSPSNGILTLSLNGSNVITSSTALAAGTWNHVAVTRSDTTVSLWINGVNTGTATSSVNLNGTGTFYAGITSAGRYAYGYISNFRAVKGTAVYTGNFTPPTAPLTAISGTSLLTCQDKGSIVDASTNSFAVTRVGDSKPVGMTPFAQKQAGYWSTNFANTAVAATHSLSIADNAALRMGTGDFTIEYWINPTDYKSWNEHAHFTKGNINTAGGLWIGDGFATGNIEIYANGSYVGSSTNALVQGSWNHVAVVRSGTTMTVYVNGVNGLSFTSTHNFSATDNVYISRQPNGSYAVNGAMSNLRVVKGTAVYTGNFTPPVAPLTAIAGTSLLTLQDNRFRDNSPNNFTVTPTGSPTVSRLNPFGPSLPAPTVNLASAGSVYFDGSGDRLTLPTSSAFTLGTGDFTIECWYLLPASISSGNFYLFDLGNNGTRVQFYNNNIYFADYSGQCNAANGVGFSVGTWTHFAMVRSGSSYTMYINGVSSATYSGTASNADTGCVIGAYGGNGGNAFPGYISNFRIVKGTAVYTAPFTPSTSPLTAISGTSLLTCQDAATVTDASSNNFTVTKVGDAKAVEATPFKRVSTVYGGSGYFDGSGDYLNVPSNSVFSFGTGDFTVEFWAYPTATGASAILGINYGSGYWAFFGNYSDSNYTQTIAFFATDGVQLVSPDYSFRPNQWTHVAVTRSGTSMKLFVNGVQVASATSSVNLTNSNALYVGRDASLGRDYFGYVSNVRIVKGVAVYSANFTPPVAPVEPVGGTSLLLNFDNAGIYDGSGNNVLQTVGGSTTSTSLAKYGTSSQKYDGTTGYLASYNSSTMQFGTGDFTLEAWAYFPTSISGNYMLFDGRGSADGAYPSVYVLSGGTLYYYANSANRITGTTLSADTWYHIAVSRVSGSTRLFVNGSQVGSTYTDTTNYLGGKVRIGASYSGNTWLSGYMDDVRVTNGVARYTANFTPPTLEAATQKG